MMNEGASPCPNVGNVIVDDSPLHHAQAKESLKVKLLVRRPMMTLVEQGILPSPKTSPALHEQRTKLERAQMGDLLRAKIARRPQREELVHRHILEDVRPGVAPALCERQMQLKRARLADTLSSQLSSRPGPLELIKKNILHTEDEGVEQALKEGQIRFTPTKEGLRQTALLPADMEEDSQSEGSTGAQSPPGGASPSQDTTQKAPQEEVFLVPKSYGQQRSAPGKDTTPRKKKAKPKGSKQRTIKFHEYKGPPTNPRKSSSEKSSDDNYTSYDLLLQQQQLYLQWQLQTQQQKYQQLILPATSGSSSGGTASSRASTPIKAGPAQQDVNDAIHMLSRLEDMKVNDLKAELKKRNLTISGPKPLLIDRLKPHLEAVVVNARLRENSPGILQSPASPALSMDLGPPSSPFSKMETEAPSSTTPVISHPPSPDPPIPPPPPPPPPKHQLPSLQLIIHQAPPPQPGGAEEDESSALIIESQRKQIQELQMALEKSRSQLELQRQHHQQQQQFANNISEIITPKQNHQLFNPVIKSSSLPNFNQDNILPKVLGNELNEFISSGPFNNKNIINNNHSTNFNHGLTKEQSLDSPSISLECDNFHLPGDDVLDLLLRSEEGTSCFGSQDTDSSSEQLLSIGGKTPPPPPPLPKMSFAPPPPLSNSIDFSPMGLSDLPFDEFPEELPPVSNDKSSSSVMDVDQDVGDWLDSLLPSVGTNNNNDNERQALELNGNFIGLNDLSWS